MTDLEIEYKEIELKQIAEKLLKDCKYVTKLIIKSLILNLFIVALESLCIYNLFVIKNDGYKYLSKNFCIICLIFTSIIGLRSIHYIIENIKQLFKVFVIQTSIKKFII